MQNLAPPSNLPKSRQPNRAPRSRFVDFGGNLLTPDLPDLHPLPALSKHLASPAISGTRILRILDRAHLSIESMVGIYNRYDLDTTRNAFAFDYATQSTTLRTGLYFHVIFIVPLAEKADYFLTVQGGIENADIFVEDAALQVTKISFGSYVPLVVVQDKVTEALKTGPTATSPASFLGEKVLTELGLTGSFYVTFGQVVGDNAIMSADIGSGQAVLVMTAFDSWDDNLGLNGGYGWFDTGIVYTYVGLAALEDFESSTLTHPNPGFIGDGIDYNYRSLTAFEDFESGTVTNPNPGFNGDGIVYTYRSLTAYDDFETSTGNGGFGWVSGALVPPTILTQPTSTLAIVGSTASFHIIAWSTAYQWYQNGVPLTDGGRFSGTATDTLTITGVTAGDFTTYYCVVTGINSTLQSTTAVLNSTTTYIANWVSRVVANGGATPSVATQTAMTNFLTGLSTDGLYGLMISVNCFVPDSLIAALTPLIVGTGGHDPWTNNNFVSTDLTVNGLVGNASNKYLDTGIVPNVVFPNNTNLGMTLYCSAGNNTAAIDMGSRDNSTAACDLYVNWSDGYSYSDLIGSSSGRIAAGNSVWVGYLSANRTAANAHALYKANSAVPHATLVSSAGASDTAPPSRSFFVFGTNNAGGLLSPSNRRLSFAAIHFGLTSAQSQSFYNRIQTLRGALGGGYVFPAQFTSQPATTYASVGGNASFSVTATGTGSLSYLWFKNNVALSDGGSISGSATSTLTITGATTGDMASYKCQVTDANGFVFSNAANLIRLDTLAADWATRVVAHGGAVPSSITQNALQAFANGMNSDGLLGLMITANCFVPDNLIAALTPFIVGPGYDPWTNHNFVSSDLTIDGLQGDSSTRYLDTGINPGLGHFPAFSFGMTAFSTTAVDSPIGREFGVFSDGSYTTGYWLGISNGGGGNTYGGVPWNGGTAIGPIGNSLWKGYISINRTSQTASAIYKASTTVAHVLIGSNGNTATDYRSINAFNIYCFAGNRAGTVEGWSVRRYSFAALHLGLTSSQSAAFYARIQALRAALGGGYGTPTVSITAQPMNQTVADGVTANFSVAATGSGSLSYQWIKNGAYLSNGGNISGATTNALTVSSVGPSDMGSYVCRVSDTTGPVNSNSAKLVVASRVGSDWANRVVINGGAAPSTIAQNAVQAFADGLVTDGIFAQMLMVNCFAWDNLTAALTPIIAARGNDPWTNHGLALTDLNIDGLAGDAASKYLDTGFIPSVVFPNNTNAAITLYYSANTAGSASVDLGARTSGAGTNAFELYSWSDGNTYFSDYGVGGSGGLITVAMGGWTGYLSGNRTSAGAVALYKANSSVAHTSIGSISTLGDPTVAFSLYCLATNQGGGAVYFSSRRISFAAVHQGLTSSQSAAFYARILALRSALGGGFVTRPVITSQPVSQGASVGDSKSFTVAGTGNGSLSYKWSKDGVYLSDGGHVSGSMTAMLTISNIANADAGVYRAWITDSIGSVVSDPAQLVIAGAVVSSWVSRVVANGGATPSVITQNALQDFVVGLIIDGTYPSMVSMNCFVPDNLIAALTPLIVGTGGKDPWTNHGFVSGDLTFNGLAGDGSAKYLESGIVPSAVFPADGSSGGMTVYCTVGANIAAIDIGSWNSSSYTSQPYDLYVNYSDGNTYSDLFGVSSGRVYTGNSVYAGYMSANRIGSSHAVYVAKTTASHATLMSNASPSDAGLPNYQAFIFAVNAGGSAADFSSRRLSFAAIHSGLTSAQSAALYARVHTLRSALGGGYVTPTAVITSQPSNQIYGAGGSASFTVAATGSGSLSYKWAKDGVFLSDGGHVSGSATAVLALSNLDSTDLGNYQAWVTDSTGSVVSNVATFITSATVVANWVSRVATNGGASPSTATQNAVKAFVDGLLADSLFNLMQHINCFVPDNITACLTPLVANIGSTFYSVSGFTSGNLSTGGLLGNGSTFLNTGILGTNTTLNNVGWTIYASTLTGAGTEYDFGYTDNAGTVGMFAAKLNQGGTTTGFLPDNGAGGAIAFSCPGTGYYSFNRVSATDFRAFFANSTNAHSQKGVTTSAYSGAIQAQPLYLFTVWAWQGGTTFGTVADGYSFFAVHSGLSQSQSAAFYARIQTLRTALGGGYV